MDGMQPTRSKALALAALIGATSAAGCGLTGAPAGSDASGRLPQPELSARAAVERSTAGTQQATAAAQCFGRGFEPTAADAERAEALMRRRLTLPPHRTVTLPKTLTWQEDPLRDNNWQFNFHTLRWADVLRREGVRTGNTAMTERHQELLRDWLAKNPRSAPPSKYSWSDMGTGLRAVTLSCAIGSYGPQSYLTAALRDHASVLAEPTFGKQVGNHALHVRNGLLVAGCVLDRQRWRAQAHRGITSLLAESVDEQGVSNEGSAMYHALNYRWYQEARRRLRDCGLVPGQVFDRVDRMPLFAAHVTTPLGTYEQLGDSDRGKAMRIAGTEAEYAATGGAKGPRPEHTYRAFDAGYVFGRSGWGWSRSFDKETFYSLRYGPPLNEQVHAHEDAGSLTLTAHGTTLLSDPGRYNYNTDPLRRHLASRAAHNIVDVRGVRYRRDVPTDLMTSRHTPEGDLTTVRVTALDGTTWTRTVFYSRTGDYLLVDDRLISATPRTMTQRWNLAPRSRPVITAGSSSPQGLTTHGPGANVSLLWLGSRLSVSVASGQEDPLRGWHSNRYGEVHAVPTVEATTTGRVGRFTTLIVPRPPGTPAAAVAVTDAEVTAGSVRATVRIGDHVETVRVTPDQATVVPQR